MQVQSRLPRIFPDHYFQPKPIRLPVDTPRHVTAPPVERVVRYQFVLGEDIGQFENISANTIALQDATDYLAFSSPPLPPGSVVYRYVYIRILRIKVWGELANSTTNLASTASQYSLIVEQANANALGKVTDSGTQASTKFSCGLVPDLANRMQVTPCTSTSGYFGVTTEPLMAGTDLMNCIADITVIFQS